ncbi:2,3-dihydro-2,3-dihydroxybenzoate dehydrogenase [Pollutimonas harenae]|uniref:2,3-dihydro-2,3-dihydroxybenzoate dehydrogenase n=1 Tax=Pollutimonas harenae TaxID=657015 RepID=A0A853H4R1_9BURK|nr:2,3-dihydro-2,3-dihydroxybenzoate dehydrogenase [Pollutimonas harenae]NYT86165.1 2,3-dihydro-2,3-dihydroxybenzoate dehydrogenase [Pollutimonas harenae]TEA71202.1 2,3-dihydro-2,3-dihydroxybenzoate dehydrogenase [Pollutimonas harenae]
MNINNMNEFSGQCVVISGAGRGIGRAITQKLLDQGARVIALDLDIAPLQALQTHHVQQLYAAQVDVSDFDAVAQAVSKGSNEFGPADKLVCAAGILQMGTISELTPEQWTRTFSCNTNGVFNLCNIVSKQMQARGRGAIVNISSNAASTPRLAMGAYAASKAAVTQLSRCLGLELAQSGIRVNIVSPGSTDTPMQQAMWKTGSSAQTVINGSAEHYRLGIPLQKIATPDEIADAVLFLLSDRASHITMHDLRVDGGATLDQ